MNFEEKVKSMSAKEIIMAMVDALTHPPVVNIKMSTFGEVRNTSTWFDNLLGKKKYKCFGCAATNIICKIANISPEELLVPSSRMSRNDTFFTDVEDRAKNINTNESFLREFEKAIDSLRRGIISDYNFFAKRIGVAQISLTNVFLPYLDDNYTNEHLEKYKTLAESQ